jgi:hypothetical protein
LRDAQAFTSLPDQPANLFCRVFQVIL